MRSYAMDQIRDSHFDADSFAHKTKTRQGVAGVLSRTEDWIEGQHPRWPERESIKSVRRRIEQELWP